MRNTNTLLPYPSIFGSLATNRTLQSHWISKVAIPFYFRVTCNGAVNVFLSKCIGCHTLLFSGHLQQSQSNLLTKLKLVAIPFYFRVTCNGSGIVKSFRFSSCHTLLFSGHLQRTYPKVTNEEISCHTLLFSGHLQPAPWTANSLPFKLPYPSIFGSLATFNLDMDDYDQIVAIPFYFRVTCNTYKQNYCGGKRELPYPSIFGSLATNRQRDANCHAVSCHTLLFSGHLQHIFPYFNISIL